LLLPCQAEDPRELGRISSASFFLNPSRFDEGRGTRDAVKALMGMVESLPQSQLEGCYAACSTWRLRVSSSPLVPTRPSVVPCCMLVWTATPRTQKILAPISFSRMGDVGTPVIAEILCLYTGFCHNFRLVLFQWYAVRTVLPREVQGPLPVV